MPVLPSPKIEISYQSPQVIRFCAEKKPRNENFGKSCTETSKVYRSFGVLFFEQKMKIFPFVEICSTTHQKTAKFSMQCSCQLVEFV